MFKKFRFLLVLLLVGSFILAACGGGSDAADTGSADDASTEDQAEADTSEDTADADAGPVEVRWYVGLGAGSDEPTFAAQEAVVEAFNNSQDEITLVLEIVDNDVAYDTLATQIAAGNAPDIVGPVGIRGRDAFKGAWLDLSGLIDSNSYDLSDFDPAMVDFYFVQEEGQLGIPFAIFPSFIIYNADLFDEAGLNYPPASYGEAYVWPDGTEAEWNMDTLREVSMILTVDANGNDATSADFDPENIVQFGFQNQWTDPRGTGTFFGAGSIVDGNGDPQIPAKWEDAWRWNVAGMWEDWFIPNGPYGGADFLQGPGGPFSSGNLGMIHMHMWYVAPWALGDVPFAWNLAATPSYNGVVTSKMHADTFGILKASDNPEAAFEVLTYLLSVEGATDLLNIYGGMPARLSMQPTYFETYGAANFPDTDVNWDIVVASMAHADNPNHESYMPGFTETETRYNEFWNVLTNEADADFDAQLASLLEDLQVIFDAAE